MKKFVQILLMTLVVVECFLFFGGYAVFDFSRRYYTAGAACSFIISLILYGFLVQAEKIEELEKRIQEIETGVAQSAGTGDGRFESGLLGIKQKQGGSHTGGAL